MATATEAVKRARVAAILAQLPSNHPARTAFGDGAPIWKVARMAEDHPAIHLQLGRVLAVNTMLRAI
jgi:hypothetical protein